MFVCLFFLWGRDSGFKSVPSKNTLYLESVDALRVVFLLKVSNKVLMFIFIRMKCQLVKYLPSCCEIPSTESAAPEGVSEVVRCPRVLHHRAVLLRACSCC